MTRRSLLHIFCLLSMCAPLTAHSQESFGPSPANASLVNTVFTTSANNEPYSALRHDVGFRIQADDLKTSFLVSPLSIKIFTAMESIRSRMPSFLPLPFKPIVEDIANFMIRMQTKSGVSAEKSNGLSNWQLAIKITRLSFCFGTDPKGVAAQIYTESKFDRARVSRTGAVGFTQMTGAAIDEVNDQLGNRGHDGAMSQNIPYLQSAISCYMGKKTFKPMFEAGVIRRGDLVTKSETARARAKAWLQEDLDRDLIYGQITLKVLLGYTKANGHTGEAAYLKAFKKYNAEPRGRDERYARDNIAEMRTI